MQNTQFIFDFDSTFTKVEALDVLSDIVYEGSERKEEVSEKIISLTELAMEGKISFREALQQRLELLSIKKEHLQKLIEALKGLVSDSIKRNKSFFHEYHHDILIVSSGFKDFIIPVVAEYGITAQQVHANEFTYDQDGNVTGFMESNPLSEDKGKVKLLQKLQLEGEVVVIGDGYTDFEIYAEGYAKNFFAFFENVERKYVKELTLKHKQHIVHGLDEILYILKHPMATSFPKSKIKVLLLENIHPQAQEILMEEGYQVELLNGALEEDELCEKVKGVHILGIRSKTNVTAKVLDAADKLMLIGAFCIGTNQIDLPSCTKHGVTVFNAPYSNTRSVVELAIGEIILLMRNIPSKVIAMRKGVWDKSAKHSYEVRGKKLGIIGYGNIGSQLSILAEAMGMDVYYYDIVEKLALGNATKVNSLNKLLATCDVISLHVDGRPQNTNFFGKTQFEQMKEGAILVNLARGPVVEINALNEALRSGKIRGAGVDVFPTEPKNNKDTFDSPLSEIPNIILTPHIGGSTLEAQENIASFVPSKMIEYVNLGSTFNSVNFPNLQLPGLENAHRLLHIHKNVSGILAKINNVLAQYDINIVGQYLKTNEDIGYVITDIDKAYNQEVINELKEIDHTIRFRVLY